MFAVYMIAAAAIGYVMGSIPFGAIYVKLKTGQNLTQIGSGRTGGTNSMRAAGWKVGFATAISDVIKGAVAVLLVRWLLAGGVEADLRPWLDVAAGIFAVVGHNWSLFLKGRGGAGTGPNVGWGTAVWWPIFPIGFAIMLSFIFVVGYASVGSMLMALIIPIVFAILYFTGSTAVASTPAYIIGGLITSAIVAFALRSNFARLARGEERLVGLRAKRRERKEVSKT